MRTLAGRSAAAAKEIKALIGDSVDKAYVLSQLVSTFRFHEGAAATASAGVKVAAPAPARAALVLRHAA